MFIATRAGSPARVACFQAGTFFLKVRRGRARGILVRPARGSSRHPPDRLESGPCLKTHPLLASQVNKISKVGVSNSFLSSASLCYDAMLPESRSERGSRGGSHVLPHWVKPDATFFLTVNCRERGENQLPREGMAERLFSSISHYHQAERWWPQIVLLMPDHLHALISFSWREGQGINAVLGDWKRYTARAFRIEWQRDFFEHRIRNDIDHQDKWAYIRENPVRAGLVKEFHEWPHVWFPHRTGWSSNEG